ncbi:hypothetical protein RKD49_000067 [Streptomyces glaucescens]
MSNVPESLRLRRPVSPLELFYDLASTPPGSPRSPLSCSTTSISATAD